MGVLGGLAGAWPNNARGKITKEITGGKWISGWRACGSLPAHSLRAFRWKLHGLP